jgi:hypothetical protein
VFIAPDGYFASRSAQLAALAARDRMPTSHFVYDAVVAAIFPASRMPNPPWAASGRSF